MEHCNIVCRTAFIKHYNTVEEGGFIGMAANWLDYNLSLIFKVSDGSLTSINQSF